MKNAVASPTAARAVPLFRRCPSNTPYHRAIPVLLVGAILAVAPACFGAESAAPAAAAKTRVACVGDSITYGDTIRDRNQNSYPAQMQAILGEGYDVRNFGVNGLTMLKHGDMPYWNGDAYKRALAFEPDVVVIALGTNDSKPQNWKFKDEFATDARAMIESFRALPSKPRVLLCLPMPAFSQAWNISDDVILKEQIPILRQLAYDMGVELVDQHTAFLGKQAWFRDGIHPNADGAGLAAKIIGRAIAFDPDAEFDVEKSLGDLGQELRVSSFYGYRQLDFTTDDGHRCTVVRPVRTAAGRPIVWRGEFFGRNPQTDLALLQCGYHVVYVDTGDQYGAPPAMRIWETFHTLLAKAGLSGKIVLIGVERGGLSCYHWAALHPDTVSAIYGESPVCDIKSWPGRDRNGDTQKEWAALMASYGFQNDAEAMAYEKNPVDTLAPLAKAGIPIIHVVGQDDTVVPVEQNTDVIEQRYKALGGTIEVIRKPTVGHAPNLLPNPEPVVDFILEHAKQLPLRKAA